MKDEYLKVINKQLESCDDISILNLIFQLLTKTGCVSSITKEG